MPPTEQMQIEILSSAGWPSSNTVTAPGVQGVAVAGTHGPASAVQVPNGLMFTIGTWSMMLAASWLPQNSRWTGSTVNSEGTLPKVHISCAPFTTCIGI